MSQALSDYFAREAGEYLAELERLLRSDDSPDVQRIFRLARGVRGSAQVAQADGVAEVSARLEGAARFVLEGRIPWSDELRDRALRTVSDLSHLVGVGAHDWGAAEDTRVSESLSRWGGFEDVVQTPSGVDAADAVSSFVQTELAALAGALGSAIEALHVDSTDHVSLKDAMRRIRTLRGVSGSTQLSAVSEILDGSDELLGPVLAGRIPVEGERLELLEGARDALRAVIAGFERGAPIRPGLRELERFRALRDRLADSLEGSSGAAIVPIHSLFYDDEGPTVISSPVAPAVEPTDGLDMRDLDSYLRDEAASVLDSADGLLAGAAMHPATDTPAVLRRVSELAGVLGDLAETYRRAGLVAISREAQAELNSARSTADARATLARFRNRLAEQGTMVAFAEASAAPAPAGAPLHVPPDEDADVVPIDGLLLRGDAAIDAALGLRPAVDAAIVAGERGREDLERLMAEIWDLLELARGGESRS